MPYVFYDVETTGLRKRYDQLVSFAAVRTDNDLTIVDKFEIRARVNPHIIPSPGAIYVTGATLAELFDPNLPSLFEAVSAIHAKLTSWGEALYLGYNSLDFDEELLRHSFYQNLRPAYLTSTNRNARADVLGLARVTAVLRPDVLVAAEGVAGRATFRLAELARANGLTPTGAHSAMADVTTTLAISRHVRQQAPEVWSQFQRFAAKSVVESFLANEEAFVFFDAKAGGEGPFVLTQLGRHPTNPARVYCLNPLVDLDHLAGLNDDAIKGLLASKDSPVTILRTNRAPMMTEVFQVAPDYCNGLAEDQVMERAARVRSDPRLGQRIHEILKATERTFPPSPHVEDQLYGYDFPNWRDRQRSDEFHAGSWQSRAALVHQFEDGRLQRLSQRIVHFSGLGLLPDEDESRMRSAIYARLHAEDAVPWLSIRGAIEELGSLRANLAVQGLAEPPHLRDYERYLHLLP